MYIVFFGLINFNRVNKSLVKFIAAIMLAITVTNLSQGRSATLQNKNMYFRAGRLVQYKRNKTFLGMLLKENNQLHIAFSKTKHFF